MTVRWHHNPYDEVVSTLEAAYESCSQAVQHADDIPPGKGGNDIGHPTTTARNLLYEALQTARQWHEAYDYHLRGSLSHRTEF